MRVLVTGATGFIGGHFVHRLVDSGHEVHALGRVSSQPCRAATSHIDPGDVTALRGLVNDVDPDCCVHLATHFVATHTSEDVPALVESNVAFGARLLEALVGPTPRRLVNAGTAWQRARGRGYAPTSLYAATKQAFADLAGYYTTSGKLDVVTLFLFDTYGPNDTRRKLVDLLLDTAASGEPLDLSGGEQLIDLTHVFDIVTAFEMAMSPTVPSGEYAVKSGRPLTLRELVGLVREITARPVDARFGARPYRPIEMFEPWDVAPDLPRWTPQRELRAGLAELWEARRSA